MIIRIGNEKNNNGRYSSGLSCLSDELFKEFNRLADSIGLKQEKFYLLAFAMGARLSQEGKRRT